jgi:sterol desaturase/sphingolipid hydroxylase (fatty acid hydroxylase superfamily)
MEYLELFINAFIGTLDWTWKSICFEVPWTRNYFWALIVISLLVWGAEMLFPWRKQQSVFRKDFFLDGFYMFFNFFIFSMFISGVYKIISKITTEQFQIRPNAIALVDLSDFSPVVQLLIFFVVLDFVQWLTHIVLHRFSFLWKFHKVHHSVKEMGFAAHLRYHWMENILYKPFKVIALMLLGGFEPEQAFIVHFIAISIGHLNHANIKLNYGPLKYVFNNPVMHLYHHAQALPKNFKMGANFAISLSLWDYIFKTNYVPEPDKDLTLGYSDDQKMPSGFLGQLFYGFKKGD